MDTPLAEGRDGRPPRRRLPATSSPTADGARCARTASTVRSSRRAARARPRGTTRGTPVTLTDLGGGRKGVALPDAVDARCASALSYPGPAGRLARATTAWKSCSPGGIPRWNWKPRGRRRAGLPTWTGRRPSTPRGRLRVDHDTATATASASCSYPARLRLLDRHRHRPADDGAGLAQGAPARRERHRRGAGGAAERRGVERVDVSRSAPRPSGVRYAFFDDPDGNALVMQEIRR